MLFYNLGLTWWLSGKESDCQAGDVGSITDLGISPGEGNGHPLQYSCLGNPMDRGGWQAIVHGVAKESFTTQQLNSNNFYNINFCSSHFGFLLHNTIFLTALQTHNLKVTATLIILNRYFGIFFCCYTDYLLLLIQINCTGASLIAQLVKNLPAVQETWVRSLGREDPLEKEMATHSSILAQKIPWTEESGGLQSTGSQRVGHD